MKGIIKEGSELMSERAAAEVMDAGLIASAQRVEHYEMAGYGSVRTWAQQLGHSQAAKLLQQTLDEEGQTDKKLTQIAESMVNTRAASA
jgi:ferritin-like metal-binding protein YciE